MLENAVLANSIIPYKWPFLQASNHMLNRGVILFCRGYNTLKQRNQWHRHGIHKQGSRFDRADQMNIIYLKRKDIVEQFFKYICSNDIILCAMSLLLMPKLGLVVRKLKTNIYSGTWLHVSCFILYWIHIGHRSCILCSLIVLSLVVPFLPSDNMFDWPYFL